MRFPIISDRKLEFKGGMIRMKEFFLKFWMEIRLSLITHTESAKKLKLKLSDFQSELKCQLQYFLPEVNILVE